MILFLLLSLCFSQTLDEATHCMNDLEVCQTQVTILTNSLTQDENIAQNGPFKTCDPANITPISNWWADKLSDIIEPLFVCNEAIVENSYWAIQTDDGSYRSTCVGFSNNLEGACPSDEVYCSLVLNDAPVYGYAGNVLAALQEALATVTKTHPFCPKGSCKPINDWLIGEMEIEGISREEAAKICLYGDDDIDQYYYISDENTISNTCIVQGSSWDTVCITDASRVCSGISSEGLNIVGWPRQQARMVAKAMETYSRAHPQCTTA